MDGLPQTADELDEGKSITLESCSSNYLIVKFIAKGHFGKIYEVKDLNSDKIFAMKTIAKPSENMECYEENLVKIKNEKCILEIARGHPFLVGMEFCFQTPSHIVFVMDYINGWELIEFMTDRIPEYVVKFYGAELFLALRFLHDKGVIHRDVKPDNIIIDYEGHSKLIDYGLSKSGLTNNGRTASPVGTSGYSAAEVFSGRLYDCSSDWYSLGIVLYFMLVNDHPILKFLQKPDGWSVPSDKETLTNLLIESLDDDIPYPEDLSESAVGLLSGLLEVMPEDRLGREGYLDIMQHEFFADIEWDKIEKKELPAPWKDEAQLKKNQLNC